MKLHTRATSSYRRAILIGPLARGRSWRALIQKLQVNEKDFRVGIDGGVRGWLELGLSPQLCVGDWDSLGEKLRKSVLKRFPHQTLPEKKDRSDFYFALQAAVQSGAREVIALGVSGGRPDHHLAVILDAAEAVRSNAGRLEKVRLLAPEAEYVIFSGVGKWKARLPVGTWISVFALLGTARGVTLRGMEFPLVRGDLAPSSHGLSNRVISKGGVEVQVREGCLLVVFQKHL